MAYNMFTGFGNVMNSRNTKVDQDKEASDVPEENPWDFERGEK